MKVIIDAAKLDEANAEVGRQEITLEQVGSQAWIRIKFPGQSYDIDYREFWDAARSVCIDSV